MCTIPSAPVQSVLLVCTFILNQVTEAPITSAPIQSVSTLHAASPIAIIKTLVAKSPMELIYCMFTLKKVLTSLENVFSSQSIQRYHRLPIFMGKVASHHLKVPFLKESHLRYKKPKTLILSKSCFVSFGWKAKRESRIHQMKIPKSI